MAKKITEAQIKELKGLGLNVEEINKLDFDTANDKIKELNGKAEKSPEVSPPSALKLVGKYAHLKKGKIHSPHLLRGSIDIETLLSRPEFYLRNEAKRQIKDAARNEGKAKNVYPLLAAFGITEKSEIQKLTTNESKK